MKIDIDLNKITDLSKDTKKALLDNKKEIASLKKMLKVREDQIQALKHAIHAKDHELNEFTRLRFTLKEFFSLGQDSNQ